MIDEPAMSPTHIKAVLDCLLAYNPVHVLEWGSGGSTIHFPHVLNDAGHRFTWTALETDPAWARRVELGAAGLPVTCYGFDQNISTVPASIYQSRLKELALTDYVDWPLDKGCKWDVVIVDGRKRARCIAVAKQVLADGGVILLHDAQRDYYHDACEGLDIVKHRDSHGEQLWEMKLEGCQCNIGSDSMTSA